MFSLSSFPQWWYLRTREQDEYIVGISIIKIQSVLGSSFEYGDLRAAKVLPLEQLGPGPHASLLGNFILPDFPCKVCLGLPSCGNNVPVSFLLLRVVLPEASLLLSLSA